MGNLTEIKVLLCDDHTIMRQGLAALLASESAFILVGAARDGREAVSLCRETRPDVVVMDIAMPEMNGIEAARLLRAESPETRVLMLSMSADRRYVIESLKSGALGYLLKDCAATELIEAVHVVARGETYLSPRIAGEVVRRLIESLDGATGTAYSDLTSREREVLQLLAEGNTTKGIADTLMLSPKTVESHRVNIMQKLDVSSIAELVKYAIREGLTSS